MKTLQIPFCFPPDPAGGTEVYVERLSMALEHRGVAALVAAPGEADAAYRHQGLRVRRYRPGPFPRDLAELYGTGDPVSAGKMARLLEEERPDIVHLHALSRAVSLPAVREARRAGCRVVLTYHTPQMSCQRGTLLRWGTEVCDGRLDAARCAGCTLEGLRVPRAAAKALARVPEWVGRALERVRFSGGPWTALAMRRLVALHCRTVRAILAEADHLVVPCRWGRELLVGNGVPPEKITLCRHPAIGRIRQRPRAGDAEGPGRGGPLRVAAMGRMSPVKGIHRLIEALRAVPALPVTLDIYGIAQGDSGAAYLDRLKALTAADPKIRFCPPVPPDQVAERLRGYDLLAVPSLGLETGPLVIPEAFAAGVPVIGSAFGGIAEWVREGENGLLVQDGSAAAWREKIVGLAGDPDQLARLRRGIRPPGTMEEVAAEMIRLYKELLRNQRAMA